MKNYDEEYYIVDEVYDDETLYLKATKKSANRDYEYTRMEFSEEPLFFENSYREKDVNANKIRPILKAHMNMNFLLVNDAIREKLKFISVPGFQLYPSIIIDDSEKYHEGFWLFNIYDESDFLNIDDCVIDYYDEDDDEHSIKKYSLDKKTLDNIPESNRLIFRPLRSDVGHTIIYKKVVDILIALGADNLRFYQLSDWVKGNQFR